MSQEERFGTRDRTYSAWHRRHSTRRYVGLEAAQSLAMIDVDVSLYVEYDDGTKEPLALIETAIDRGQEFKTATVTKRLAMRSVPLLPAYVALYTQATWPNPADPAWPDIYSFRVRRIWPEPVTPWEIISPQEWAIRLYHLRHDAASALDQSWWQSNIGHVT
ncbi:MAG: hypothetical protein HQL90_05755 [Magnetococcales bacterium]|nr:hypothetical protein [Magnetococcales bacterium]